MIGKLPPELLDALTSRTGAADARVLQGPAYGEDTAAIRLGPGDDESGDEGSDEVGSGEEDSGEEGTVLVVNADPISLAVERIGTLGVNVACNDVAASGGSPEWLTSVLFLPDDAVVEEIATQLDEAARRLGVSIVGGHAEYAPDRSDPLLVLTCLGLAERYVPTGGARPGDRVIVTKGAGIEGTAILATDFRDRLSEVPAVLLERAAGFYDDVGVVEEAAALAEYATAMHDPTEGGLVDGLLEVALASGVTVEVDPGAIPVRPETRRLCEAVGVDPLRIFGSGALVATAPEASVAAATRALTSRDVPHAVVGRVREAEEPSLVLGGETYTEPVRDDMYDLWA